MRQEKWVLKVYFLENPFKTMYNTSEKIMKDVNISIGHFVFVVDNIKNILQVTINLLATQENNINKLKYWEILE